MEAIVYLLYLLGFFLIIRKLTFFNPVGIPSNWVTLAFLLKIPVSFMLYLLYTQYYPDRATADIFKYYDDSKVLHDLLFNKPWDYFRILFGVGNDQAHFNQYYHQMNNWCGIYPSNVYGDGHLMIRLNAVARLLSGSHYHVHALFVSMFSFTGLMGMYRVFAHPASRYQPLVFVLLFTFPGLLFWTSGVLKEGLIIFALGMILYQADILGRGKAGLMNWLMLLASFILLRYSKFYLFAFFLPLVVAYFLSLRFNRLPAAAWFMLVLAVFISLGFLAGTLDPTYDVSEIISRKQQDFIRVAREAKAGSTIEVAPLQANLGDILRAAVPGFLNTLTRPYPWEIKNPLMLLSGIENLLICCFVLYGLIRARKPVNLPLFFLSIIFFISVYMLSGLIAPVMGALARYKVPALPFLFFWLALLLGKRQVWIAG